MTGAVSTMNKIEHFISDCDNYIAGRWSAGNVDEVTLLRVSVFVNYIINVYMHSYSKNKKN